MAVECRDQQEWKGFTTLVWKKQGGTGISEPHGGARAVAAGKVYPSPNPGRAGKWSQYPAALLPPIGWTHPEAREQRSSGSDAGHRGSPPRVESSVEKAENASRGANGE